MGRELYWKLEIASEKGPIYWWPLSFEAMRRQSFSFTAPNQAAGVGSYFYRRLGDETDADLVTDTFRRTWNEIYAETSQMLIAFWYIRQEPFPFDVSIEQQENAQTVQILLTLSDAELIDLSFERVRHRFRLLLDCVKALYEVCKPCSGELFWEGSHGLLGALNKPLETAFLQERKEGGREMRLVEQVLPDGSLLSLVNPIPLRVRGGWDFVSLVEEQG